MSANVAISFGNKLIKQFKGRSSTSTKHYSNSSRRRRNFVRKRNWIK